MDSLSPRPAPRARSRRIQPLQQTSAHLGAERADWLAARAEAAGTSRCAALLALWPRAADGALIVPQPRHPRAPVPVRLRGSGADVCKVLTLNGPEWVSVSGPLLATLIARRWTLSAVARAVIDDAVEGGL